MTDLTEKQRADFEAWAHKENYSLERDEGGVYLFSDTLAASCAFKAARATPAPQAAPSELEIDTGLRLRLVCELLGLGNAVQEDPAELYAVAFSALGMVRHEIENLQRAAAPLTQAADQRTAGDVWRLIDAYADAREEYQRSTERHLAKQQRENMEYAKAELTAALAATPAAPLSQECEPVVCDKCSGTGVVDDGEINHYSNGEPFACGPVKCVKDCAHCRGTGKSAARAPLPAQQASESLYNAVEELRDYVAEDRGLDVNIDPIALLQSKAEESGGDFTVPSSHLWAVFQALAAMGDARKGGGDAQ